MAITGASKLRSYAGDYMEAGVNAQDIVLDFLRKRPNVIGVEDLSLFKVMQEADVDCMIKTRDGLVTLAEIKSDQWIGKSGNILFEVLRINHTAAPDHCVTLGWTAKTPAKFLIYYSPELNRIYIIASDDLRRGMQKYTSETRATSRISYVATDNIKSTINILVPEKYCKFTSYDLFDENA